MINLQRFMLKVLAGTLFICVQLTIGMATDVQSAFTDNGDGSISDENTGLVWQQSDDGQLYNWYLASGTYQETLNPASETGVCDNLTLPGSGWRLPSIEELAGLVDARNNPTIDPVFSSQSAGYWTSTKSPHPGEVYEYISFLDGFSYGGFGLLVDSYGSFHAEYYVRCVREGAAVEGLVVEIERVNPHPSSFGQITFSVDVVDAVAPLSYEYDFGTGFILSTNAGTVSHTFTTLGWHQVHVTVTDAQGTIGTASTEQFFAGPEISSSEQSIEMIVGQTKQVNISGGMDPYSLIGQDNWGTFVAAEMQDDSLSLMGLRAGTVEVQVTDVESGQTTISVTVVEPSDELVDFSYATITETGHDYIILDHIKVEGSEDLYAKFDFNFETLTFELAGLYGVSPYQGVPEPVATERPQISFLGAQLAKTTDKTITLNYIYVDSEFYAATFSFNLPTITLELSAAHAGGTAPMPPLQNALPDHMAAAQQQAALLTQAILRTDVSQISPQSFLKKLEVSIAAHDFAISAAQGCVDYAALNPLETARALTRNMTRTTKSSGPVAKSAPGHIVKFSEEAENELRLVQRLINKSAGDQKRLLLSLRQELFESMQGEGFTEAKRAHFQQRLVQGTAAVGLTAAMVVSLPAAFVAVEGATGAWQAWAGLSFFTSLTWGGTATTIFVIDNGSEAYLGYDPFGGMFKEMLVPLTPFVKASAIIGLPFLGASGVLETVFNVISTGSNFLDTLPDGMLLYNWNSESGLAESVFNPDGSLHIGPERGHSLSEDSLALPPGDYIETGTGEPYSIAPENTLVDDFFDAVDSNLDFGDFDYLDDFLSE